MHILNQNHSLKCKIFQDERKGGIVINIYPVAESFVAVCDML